MFILLISFQIRKYSGEIHRNAFLVGSDLYASIIINVWFKVSLDHLSLDLKYLVILGQNWKVRTISIITWGSICEGNFQETFLVSRYICLAGQDESIWVQWPQFLYPAAGVCLHYLKPTSQHHSCQWSSCQKKDRQGCRSLCWMELKAWFLYSSL